VWRELDGERRYCLFRRRTHPIGFYTVPAGHLDLGEEPGPAALREVFEETGLGIIQSESFGPPILFREECRRGSDEHVWDVLHGQAVGEPRLSDEGDVIGWYGRLEILNDLQLTNPTGALFETLFGEAPRHVRTR
jgi:8-oxo-dGTP pyrophosphatase MutT (NUDIX family)